MKLIEYHALVCVCVTFEGVDTVNKLELCTIIEVETIHFIFLTKCYMMLDLKKFNEPLR